MLIGEFTKDLSYKNWEKTSKDRFKFDIIVRNCKDGIFKFMNEILEIM